AGDEIELSLGLHVYSEKAEFKNSVKGYHKFFYGPMLLGRKAALEVNSLEGNRFENYAEGQYKSSDIVPLPGDSRFERVGTYEFREPESGVVLSALCEVRDMTKEDSMRQMLFTDK
ncbi:MAG: hypothetical protein FWE86_04015, partial [Oscillospiraceae bacterium]|nr:hypothetical protein [Oscillospiraceae bacterium]